MDGPTREAGSALWNFEEGTSSRASPKALKNSSFSCLASSTVEVAPSNVFGITLADGSSD